MPPPMRYGAPNNVPPHYQHQPYSQQAHNAALPPPTLGSTQFMNSNSMNNPFGNNNALSMGGSFGGSALGMPGATGLGSHSAQMSFATAPLQHQTHNGMNEPRRAAVNKGRIREVWKSNLHEEMNRLRQLVDDYQFVAMDTEFPGVVARPMGSFNGKSDYHYQCLRCNVDLLKIIQLGITLYNKDGELPSADSGNDTTDGRNYGGGVTPCTWQFNFKFSLDEDMYSENSIQALRQAGVHFENLDKNGIDPFEFGALLMSSGLVCDEEVSWISFHGGYDFGYLTKLLLRLPLPDDEHEFDKYMKKFFPSVYDIKYLMKHAARQQPGSPDALASEVLLKFEQKSGLESLAESLKAKRQGNPHQAGSDSLLTGNVFFRMIGTIFNGHIPEEFVGKVWGLGFPSDHHNPQQSTPQHYNSQLQENSTPNGHMSGTPSTPNTANVGLAHTPQQNIGGLAPMTPGGGGGVFGSFQMSSRNP